MDNGKGNFVPITEKKFEDQMSEPEPMVFREGEILSIRGSRLRVEKIYKRKITLKLLSQLVNQLK